MASNRDLTEIVLLFATAVVIFGVLLYGLGLVFLALALAAVIVSIGGERLLRYWERRFREDERLIRINNYAAMNVLLGVLVVTFILNGLAILHMLPGYTAQDVAITVGFLMFLLYAIWLVYYYFKGDVA